MDCGLLSGVWIVPIPKSRNPPNLLHATSTGKKIFCSCYKPYATRTTVLQMCLWDFQDQHTMLVYWRRALSSKILHGNVATIAFSRMLCIRFCLSWCPRTRKTRQHFKIIKTISISTNVRQRKKHSAFSNRDSGNSTLWTQRPQTLKPVCGTTSIAKVETVWTPFHALSDKESEGSKEWDCN